MLKALFDDLIQSIPNLSVTDRALLEKAFECARLAHSGQKRQSGEDYLVHCVEVARILADLGMDSVVVSAGILHDTAEDTSVNLAHLEREFGAEISGLVSGVTKMEHVALDSENIGRGRQKDRESEFLRKTLLAMSDDIRVVLIKLADRLHNMRTLGYLPVERQRRMAQETLEIFAPLASRLGIWQLKWELEDLSFRYMEPERYKMIAQLIDERRVDRDAYVARIVKRVEGKLLEEGIVADVSGRSKHMYSIWRKMERRNISFDQVFDVHAVRILVADIACCYQVLGIVHQLWRPVMGEFDDYIAAPKDNFYQSLHTAVILEDGRTLEVQIRTYEMHRSAEYGVAAHWRYKEVGVSYDDAFEKRVRHLRDMIEIGRGVEDANEFLDVMRSDVFQDRVYVFTPRGDIVDLPAGATPIDFAYYIHTDVGDRCRGAKVNGKLVSLDYILQVGDRVEILVAKRGGPSRDWLNPSLGFLKTKRALTCVRQWFRRQDREKMVVLGRDMLDRELKRLGLERMSHEMVASLFGLDRVDDLLMQIGFGDIHSQNIAMKVLDIDREVIDSGVGESVKLGRSLVEGVSIQGAAGLLTSVARCCSPLQGDEIVGYITRGRGVSIHRRDCRNILNLKDRERLIAVEWAYSMKERFPVPVVISAYDREGLLRDIGAVVAEEHINMRDVSVRTNNHVATFHVVMEVEDSGHLSRILGKIERLPNVVEARRESH
jgi:GTP pyrophosphokinase